MALYLSCEISNCGQLLVMVAQQSGTAPTNGYDQLVGITSVSGTPTLKKNGSAVTIGPMTWDQGQGATPPGSLVAALLTAGPVLATDVMTVDIPANFINGAFSAVTSFAVTNNTGKLEGAFGKNAGLGYTGCPGLPTRATTGFGANPGHPMIGNYTPNFLPWNQLLRAEQWQFAPGSSGGISLDALGNMVAWSAGQTVRLTGFQSFDFYDIAGGPGNGVDSRGYPNQVGTWTVVYADTGTLASTVRLNIVGSVSPGASCTLASSSTIGGVTTQTYNIQYTSSSPSAWDIALALDVTAPANNTGGSDGLAHWALGQIGSATGPFVSPPNMADGTALSVVRTNPFAVNPNVRQQVTASNGVTLENLRVMEGSLGDGAQNNYIYECDAPNIGGLWPVQRLRSATANHVRYFNTDPSNITYPWSSTKVYGPQGDFVLSDGVTYNVTATTTAGSLNITLSSGTLLMAGSPVSGAGIAAGTRIAYFAYGGTTTAVLSKPATASGSATLTVSNPGYLALAPGDQGGFTVNGVGQQNWTIAEFRFDLPHGLTTGQYPGGTPPSDSHGNQVTSSNFGSSVIAFGYSRIFVTGPYTLIMPWLTSPGTGSTVGVLTATTEYDFTSTGGITFGIDTPFDTAGTFPMEAHAALATDLGCNVYRNLAGWGTDEYYQAEARKFFNYSGPSTVIRLEREDEAWNGADPFYLNSRSNLARQNLYGYQASGTVIFNPYFTANGGTLPFSGLGLGLGANVLLSGHQFDVFTTAFVAAGGSPSRVERCISTQWSNPNVTDVSVGALQQWGVPCDWIVVGPYLDTPPSSSIATAFATAGGNWPSAAINDFIRLYHLFNVIEQGFYAGQLLPIQQWGQPTQISQFSNIGPVGGNFSPFGGGYCCYYTFLDASGNQTTVAQSCSIPTSFNAHDAGQFVMPPVPPWVKSVNVYVAGPGASQNDGTERLYDNYPLSTYPTGTAIQMTTTPPGITPPPSTNGAAASAGTPPALAAYEGGDEQPIPINVTNWQEITHDVLAHPSRWLNPYTWMASGQIGCQWVPGSGLAWMDYYAVWSYAGPFNPPSGNAWWMIYNGIAQVPGQGLSNQYCLKGAPADGHDHNGGAPLSTGFNGVQVSNQSPSGYGVQQWMLAMTSPSPTPTPTSTTGALAAAMMGP